MVRNTVERARLCHDVDSDRYRLYDTKRLCAYAKLRKNTRNPVAKNIPRTISKQFSPKNGGAVLKGLTQSHVAGIHPVTISFSCFFFCFEMFGTEVSRSSTTLKRHQLRRWPSSYLPQALSSNYRKRGTCGANPYTCRKNESTYIKVWKKLSTSVITHHSK